MAGKNYAFKTKHKELGESVETVTLENAASLSIYQLRQELTKRGIFDEVFGTEGEKRHINFESCLEVIEHIVLVNYELLKTPSFVFDRS